MDYVRGPDYAWWGAEFPRVEPEEVPVSVLMTLRVSGEPKAIEATAPEVLDTVVERAKGLGLIRHRFYGNDKEVLVIDEWPDQESFQKFFESSPEIKDMMERAGAGEPAIEFWHHLDVKDDVG